MKASPHLTNILHTARKKDEYLRRVTVLNDDGDLYFETTGDGSEVVLKAQTVRVDGDVYTRGSTQGLSEKYDELATVSGQRTTSRSVVYSAQRRSRGVSQATLRDPLFTSRFTNGRFQFCVRLSLN